MINIFANMLFLKYIIKPIRLTKQCIDSFVMTFLNLLLLG